MKKNFKTITAAIFAAALCASLAGCANSNDDRRITDKDIDDAISALDNYGKNPPSESKSNSEKKFEKLDPFEDLKITFSGTVPDSKITINGQNSRVSYTPSKTTGMKNGDKITVTAEVYSYFSDQYELTQTEKEYTVSGLSAYAMKLDEIPEETKEKLLKQSESLIAAQAAKWLDGNKLLGAEPIGYYYLALKDGFTSYSNTNQILCVYKVNALIGGKYTTDKTDHEDSYYTYCKFTDIMLLSGGVCSVDLSRGALATNQIKGEYGNYYFFGYKDLDSMFNAVVTKQVDKYDYESTVKD